MTNLRRMTAALVMALTVLGADAAEPSACKGVEDLWAGLAGKDPVITEKAMAQMAAEPAQTVPFLRNYLRPVSVPNPCCVARWLAELDSDDFATRERATQELEKRGEVVEAALNKALGKSPSLEARRRIKTLLERVKAERLNPSANRLQAVRAVEVLERIGDTEARQLLALLGRGAPEAQLTVEARAALKRLKTPR